MSETKFKQNLHQIYGGGEAVVKKINKNAEYKNTIRQMVDNDSIKLRRENSRPIAPSASALSKRMEYVNMKSS